MIKNDINFREILHKANLKATSQRLAICELLYENENHPTAKSIYDRLKEQYPSLSLSTIYNTLDILVGMGLVNALGSIGDDTVHFDGNTTPHINLACTKCHSVTDLSSNYVDLLDQAIHQVSGFKLSGSHILYYGICPECQNSESPYADRKHAVKKINQTIYQGENNGK